ncbi:MAG: DUF4329 domain-containing protein [Elusimicrobia bacterium]|nr:DUF4329 domain-containing protein [Elusimicrobiota bacterium]
MTGLTPLLALIAALAPMDASATPSSYATLDEAAVAFVDLVRTYPEQRHEYCAWLIKDAGGRVRFGAINEGDMNHCPSSWPKPAGTAGSVHTHPIWGPGSSDPSAASQVFSEGDFAHAEHPDVSVPAYLGAPAGHVLRYDPGGTLCWGRSFISRHFKIVRDAVPSVRGRLPLNPDEKTALYDALGKPVPKPSYCRDQPR